MSIKPLSDRATVPLGIGVLAITAIAVGWLVFEGAPFILGCIAMLALTASEIALLVRPTERRPRPAGRVRDRPYTRLRPC